MLKLFIAYMRQCHLFDSIQKNKIGAIVFRNLNVLWVYHATGEVLMVYSQIHVSSMKNHSIFRWGYTFICRDTILDLSPKILHSIEQLYSYKILLEFQ